MNRAMATDPLNNTRAAARFMLTSMLIIGLIDNFVVTIAEHSSLWQFLAVRAVFAIPLVALLAAMGFGNMRVKSLWRVAARGGLMAGGMLCYFGALGFMSISLALAGLFTAPIFVLLISAFLLKQRVGPKRIAAVAVGFLGILLVIGPNFSDLGWTVLVPIFGGLLYAGGSVATRALCEGEETFAMLWAMFAVQGLATLTGLIIITIIGPNAPIGTDGYVLRGWVWPIGPALPWIIVQAVGSVIAVAFLIRAYQVAEASIVTVFEYSVFIFGPLFAWLIWGETLGWQEALGIALIASAGILIAFRSE